MLRLGSSTLRVEGFLHGNCASFSFDNKLLACADGINVYLWEPRTGKLQRKLDYPATTVAFAPKGTVLALGTKAGDLVGRVLKTRQGFLVLVDANDGKEIARTPLPTQPGSEIGELSFTPDGTRIIAIIRSFGMYAWEANSLKEIKLPQSDPDRRASTKTFSRDGALAAVDSSKGVKLMDLRKDPIETIATLTDRAQYLTFSPDGKHLATSDYFLWRTSNLGYRHRQTETRGNAAGRIDYRQVHYSGDGKYVIATPFSLESYRFGMPSRESQ